MTEMKVKTAKLCYGFLSLQHQSSRLQLEKKYLTRVNVIMYQSIIKEHFKEAFSQQTLIALVSAGMCEGHQIILSKWARKHCHYEDNLAKKEKCKYTELEKKMATA